ncbi:Polyporopepsin [Termitomyces sp. J132]|nr:Polyporopepsin [Termitomyces sp. J132]
MLVYSSLSLLLLSFSLTVNTAVIRRDSPVNFPLKKRLDLKSGSLNLKNVVLRDVARAKSLRSRAQTILDGGVINDIVSKLIRDEVHEEGVSNSAVFYTASIGVGTPPTTYEVLVDTGSSNTWIGAQPNNSYKVTKSSVKTKDTVSVSYGSGSFSGNEFLDSVTLGSDLVLVNQSIGVATTSQGLDVDGILGIGPNDLTLRTLSPPNGQPIPTVTDTAFQQGQIGLNEIGVYFEPIVSSSQGAGQLSFGGVDTSKLIGSMQFTPVTSVRPASAYWGIEQTIQYGSEALLTGSAGIVDTGTTLVLVATDAFVKYRDAVGAVLDEDTGLLRINSTQSNQLKSLVFQISGNTLELTPNAQLWPRSLNTAIGGSNDYLYLIIADIGVKSGSGLDFINGYTFLERFYTSFDTANKKVGFAQTAFTNSTLN